MLEFVLNFLFPPVCSICGKLNKNWLCLNCEKRVQRLEKSCVIEIKNKNYEKLLYIFQYESLVRKLILRYKFSNQAYLNHFFANMIIKNEENCKLLQ